MSAHVLPPVTDTNYFLPNQQVEDASMPYHMFSQRASTETAFVPEINDDIATILYASSVSKSKRLIEALRSAALSEQAFWEKKLAELKAVK